MVPLRFTQIFTPLRSAKTSYSRGTLYAIPPPRTPLVLIESHQIRGGLKRINEFIEGNSHGK